MKLSQISCPSCGGIIKADLSKQKYIFCAYCGHQLEVDNGVKETIITNNININNRYTNDADIIRAKAESEKGKNDIKVGLLGFGLIFFAIFVASLFLIIPAIIGGLSGKTSMGNHSDYEGKNYQYVQSTFEAAGFTNIKLIDLKDEGLFVKDGEVTNVSVGGNAKFESIDYFSKDDTVVITYH